MLGGSTLRWGARGAPFQEIDFSPRQWLERSGWPLSLSSLRPYYKRAERLIGMHADLPYDEGVWDLFGGSPLPHAETDLRFCVFQFGKTLLFGRAYREALRTASNVRVYLHANVTALDASAELDRLESVEVRTLSGRRCRFQSERFVLAAGGIENARLLLLPSPRAPHGLCNQHDLVGRFFMEHPTASVGLVESDRPRELLRIFYPGSVQGRRIEIGLSPRPEVQRAYECLNAVAAVRPTFGGDATEALRRISWELKHRRRPTQFAAGLKAMIGDPVGIARNIVLHLQGKPMHQRIESLRLEVRAEQEPNPASRVTLSEQTDALGVPRARLEWRMTRRDRNTFRVTAEEADRQLRSWGLGRVAPAAWVDAPDRPWPVDLVGGHHHMGTTRMSHNPMTGVVDSDCRAHSVENLYLAGSSVFPTAGFVNPTPTLIALAVRLADHLKN